MTSAAELDRLVSALLDGELSEADQLHLAALLRDDPAAQHAYLDYLALDCALRWEKPVAAQPRPLSLSRRMLLRRAGWLLAASLLLALGAALYFGQRAEAGSDVIGRLADWNLAIASAADPAGRQARFGEQAEAFTAELAKANLSADDARLATALFENARALASQNDPLGVAERLDGMSEQLLDWLWRHTEVDPTRSQAIERHYLRFVERSLENILRVAATDAPDEVKQRRIERVTERIARRAEARATLEAERTRKKTER